MQRIIDGAHEIVRLRRQEFLDLLEKSDHQFQPFVDPLRLNFERHRWLCGDREENYSDWLDWIICQFEKPDLVMRLFGIKDDASISECRGLKPEVNREETIPSRRLDIPIRYGDKLLVVVEVKTVSVGDEVRDQLRDQRNWLNQQNVKSKHAVLLAPEPFPELSEGFSCLSWNELCITSRKLVRDLKSRLPITLLGMILGFIGSVEQNVLDYPCCTSIPSNVGLGRWPALATYIANTVNMEESDGIAEKH
jgi:hypothetical protein